MRVAVVGAKGQLGAAIVDEFSGAHEVLPLSGVTHMTAPQEQVAENLLLLQVDFLKRSLGAGH